MKTFNIPAFLLFFLIIPTLNAQQQFVDETFSNGQVYPSFNEFNGTFSFEDLNALAIQSDGKIIATGWVNDSIGVCRINTNGSIDTTFGNGGYAVFGSSASGLDVEVLPNGNILVGGRLNGNLGLVQFDANGQINEAAYFNGSTEFDLKINSFEGLGEMAILPNGKVILVGSYVVDGEYNGYVIKVNAEGLLEETFGNDGIISIDAGDEEEDDAIRCRFHSWVFNYGIKNLTST